MPIPPLPGDEDTEVMMAEAADAIEVTLPLPINPPVLPVAAPAPLPAKGTPPAAVPAKGVAALPSADPFDFGKPAPAAPTPAAKPAFGSAKAAPAPAPKAPVAKPQAAPAPVPKPAPPAPAAKAKPEPPPLSLDDDIPPIESLPAKPAPAAPAKPAAPAAKAKPAPAPEPEPEPIPEESDNPFAGNAFAFSPGDEKSEKPARSKRRDRDEEDEKPSKSKRRDEEDEKPAKSKRRDDEEDEKPRKKRKDDDEDEPPAKPKKQKAASQENAPYNPFADYDAGPAEEPEEKPTKSKRRDEDDDGKPRKKKKGDEDEPEEQEKPRYRRPEEQGGMGKTILITAVVGLFALGLGIAAVVMYIKNNKKEPEPVKKEEKKDETLAPPPFTPPVPPPEPPKPDPKPKDKNPDPKPKDKEPDPKPKDPDPKPKDPVPKPKDPGPTRPTTITLPKLRPLAVGMLPEKPEAGDKPRAGMQLEAPLASVRRVFPPFDPKSADTYVLIQTNAGFNGKGQRLALDSYGPAGNRRAMDRLDYDGDGSPTPIADLAASATGVRFLAATGGKLHVWSMPDKAKLADGVDPYAEKPDHAKAGMAAAFFAAADSNQVVTVSTAGAVLLYDLAAKKVVSEFIPPDGAPGKVSLGLSVAKADGNGSVVIAVAGVLYQVSASAGLEVRRKYDIGGDAGRSLGVAASGTPGRLIYAFETAPDKMGKKEKAILVLPLGDKAKHQLFPVPATVGDPKGALWSAGVAGGVVTDKGVLWFDDEDGLIVPMCFTQPPGVGLYFGDEKYFWYVIAHPKEATKSVLVALSGEFNDRSDLIKSFGANQPLRALKIDHNGMSK
jgi:hypothetical protein